MPIKTRSKISWHEKISYGSGDYALNLYWQGVGFYLFYFYTDVLGLPNTTAGLIFMIGGIWDAVSDPLMGYYAERHKSRLGTYRPYLLYGSTPLAISGILLFSSPNFESETIKAIYVLVLLLIFRSCYTIVSIPYSALGARLTTNPKERTSLSGVRMYFGFLGGLSISAIATLLRNQLPDPMAFQMLGVLVAVLSLIIMFYCFQNTGEIKLEGKTSKPASNLKEILLTLIANRPFIILLVGIIFITICNTFILKNILYYFEYNLLDKNSGDQAILVMTATPLLAIPAWSFIAYKLGKKATWQIAGIITILGFAFLYFDQSKSIQFALVEVSIIMSGSSAYAVLLWSMLPDTIDFGEFRSGVRNESMAIGILSSAQKATIAATAFAVGILLDIIGYKAGETQSFQTLDGLKEMITIFPTIAVFLSMGFIYFYKLDSKKLNALRKRNRVTKI